MNMQVARNSVITLDYHVTDPDGDVVDEGREPLIYLHGGYEDIFPKIEEALQGHGPGAKLDLHLEPEEAFGD
jgi:FKBP-type peptidyl-prolyl cis-trans isomerase SlyD